MARKAARASTPISATGSDVITRARAFFRAWPLSRQREGGFTLIELMIVVTIIGLASAAVVLAIPDPRGRLIDDAERFAARARAAHDTAIIEGRSVSIWVSREGYGFDRRSAGTWQPISEKPLRVARWASDIRPVILSTEGRDRVIFDSTGLANAPFDVQLRRGGEASATVRIGADGAISIDG
ncbi:MULTISPECIES: GspH/FimT family pseudopilin [unclassified Sphingomonas]|uniref:GspH/FimT family pseudopilin n=1 Tax=unclassified Sphingomonas TaxID=196159 RepID=UPI000BD85463|nr:MAG: type II secretion system protein GspH [Sphingomonas sp. 12-62-6]OYX39085.1 MAG: type II secretion system protein GspH [Sphingomonas sp. 32-62-10]